MCVCIYTYILICPLVLIYTLCYAPSSSYIFNLPILLLEMPMLFVVNFNAFRSCNVITAGYWMNERQK